MSSGPLSWTHLSACFCVLFLFLQEVDCDDPLLIVDQQDTAETIKMPNAHSAAFVMGFIFLCLLTYGAYRVCKRKCGERKLPLTVSLGSNRENLSQLGIDGLEEYMKEREEYLAIFGPKTMARDMHVCEFKQGSNSVRSTRELN